MKFIGGQLYFKILFFGSALAGKTTALQWLYDNLIPEEMKLTKKISSIKTSFGQTLLFDFMPIQIAKNVVVRIYASTGQDYYLSTRRMLFEDVDGLFFIIDSQKKELEHNREFVEELKRYTADDPDLREAQIMVLFNKQDLAEIHTPEFLSQNLGLADFPSCPTSAATGRNLREAFIWMVRQLMMKAQKRGELLS